MQTSLENLQQEVRLWQARYEEARDNLHNFEILLRKLDSQCEAFVCVKKNLEEEKYKLRSRILTLAKRNRRLLKKNVDKAWHIGKGYFLPTIIEEEEETVVDSCESQDTAPRKLRRADCGDPPAHMDHASST
ncbi:PREDICTED: daple-like protein [Myotis brandtii]|uniref:daple-like protein n=1 Tax=Myotis brandtii TaxID=109478 RepID=UPI0007046A0E|nr:PREDICTED: daple-like protein [Myotis brandtii]